MSRAFTVVNVSRFKIPSHPLSLQITVTSTELLSLAKSLIAATGKIYAVEQAALANAVLYIMVLFNVFYFLESYSEEELKSVQFDFLINGEYLRDSLQVFIERHNLSTVRSISSCYVHYLLN